MKSFLLPQTENQPNTYILDLKDIQRVKYKMAIHKSINISSHQRLMRDKNQIERLTYDAPTLELMDFLKCPILLLPLYQDEYTPQKIGFFTDLRSTSVQSVSAVKDIVSGLRCDLVIINTADAHQPPMDKKYAEKLFTQLRFETLKDVKATLINFNDIIANAKLETVLVENKIDLLVADRAKKQILYNLLRQ